MKKYLLVFSLTAILVGIVMAPKPASALSGSEFQAGRIIDDGVFFNSNAIDPASIQVFLNSKVPSCDTNGTQPYSGTTRAAYGTSRGYPPPYTCLRYYTQDTPTKAADAYCGQYNGGAKSAAKIIFDVGQACGISPKVMLVLLEKEQSLITDDWPWSIQYRSATGYGCPDTAPCDAEYYGYFNQVYNAARQFKRYILDQSSFSYRPYRNNYIQYNPNAACGGSNVYIQNQATAALYNFTPYQPNASALANLYGSGDGCGAYGNRNFWRLYSDWFGSTQVECNYPPIVQNGIYRLYNPYNYQHFLTSSPAEVCYASTIGYLYDGQLFKSSPSSTIPIYRLQKNGKHLFTTSAQERDFAVQQIGYRYEGVAFYGADSLSDPTNSRPVYRLNQGGSYVYTLSSTERDSLAADGYRYEGVGFYVYENPGTAVVPAYRLRSISGGYVYTISDQERTNAIQFYGYSYEGVGFNAINGLNNVSVPVYRQATKNGVLLTTSLRERLAGRSVGYRDQGVSMFTYGFSDPSFKPLYRLSHPSSSYLYTTSAGERDWAAQNAWYKKEGVSFQTAP